MDLCNGCMCSTGWHRSRLRSPSRCGIFSAVRSGPLPVRGPRLTGRGYETKALLFPARPRHAAVQQLGLAPAFSGDHPRRLGWLSSLEIIWHQHMAPQELVEIGTVALRESRRLTDIAAGNLQNL